MVVHLQHIVCPGCKTLVFVQKLTFGGEKKGKESKQKTPGGNPEPNRLFVQLSRGSRLAVVATTVSPPQKLRDWLRIMGPPSQIDPGSPVLMILPGTEALIRSMVIAERLRDEDRRGGPESARCEDHGGGLAPSSTLYFS
jgi:hypothetical protein